MDLTIQIVRIHENKATDDRSRSLALLRLRDETDFVRPLTWVSHGLTIGPPSTSACQFPFRHEAFSLHGHQHASGINIVDINTKNVISTAVLLAAGTGSRLAPLTDELPKCLTQVDGMPLFERLTRNLTANNPALLLISPMTGHAMRLEYRPNSLIKVGRQQIGRKCPQGHSNENGEVPDDPQALSRECNHS